VIRCFLLFSALILSTVGEVFGQRYAVQSSVQVMPPYSVYLSDYATPGVDKLRVILIQRDLSRPAYQLRLVMSVELNGKVIIRTSRSYNPPPINLDPGIPTVISGADLAGYVESRNLDFIGYSREQYEKTKSLPEGSYRIMFTAYDYRRQDQQVSNEGSGFYYLSKNEPPLINYPACGSSIATRAVNDALLTSAQQIIFSWLPRNTSSPNSVADTEYEFSLYETRPAGRNPNDVVLTTAPVYRTRTDYTQLVYGIAEPVLLEGMTYVWRVQAVDKGGKDAFRNNGFSEVCTFTYGGTAAAYAIGTVKGLRAEGETDRRGRIWWDAGDYDGYRIFYKKAGTTYEWFSSDVPKGQTELKLFDLEPDTPYEARMQGKKGSTYGEYTSILKFRTQPLKINQCGDPVALPDSVGNPLPFATAGMVITASKMEVILVDVQHTGTDGWYKGYGRVSIPYLGGASFMVKFDRLYINENREAQRGRIDVISKGAAALLEQAPVSSPPTSPDSEPSIGRDWSGVDFYYKVITYDKLTIDSVRFDEAGNLVVVDNAGATHVNTDVPAILVNAPGKAIVIEDKNGDQWVVEKDASSGKVTIAPQPGGGLPPKPVSDALMTLVMKALTTLRGAYPDSKIDALLGELEAKEGAWDRERAGTLRAPAGGTVSVGQSVFFDLTPIAKSVTADPYARAYKKQELDYNRAILVKILAAPDKNEAARAEMIVGLRVGEVALADYVAKQKAAGKRDEEIVPAIGDAIMVFIDGALRKNFVFKKL